MSRALIAAIAAMIVLLVVASASLFTVNQTQQALVTQFGRVVEVVDQPGLHVKTPFVQSVLTFDRRLLTVEQPGQEVILGDQRRLIVDSFAVFRITNPLLYYQAVGTAEGIRGRLNSVVSGSLRRVLGNVSVLLGIACFAVGFFAFLALLARADLSLLVPATALAYVVAMLGARLMLREEITRLRWAGSLLVCLGVALASLP